MHDTNASPTLFLTLVRTIRERACARTLIDSLRAFGGPLSDCPIWLFEARPESAPCQSLAGAGVQIIPLSVPEAVRHYFFADKVYACARAEEMAGPGVRSLVWIDPACLVIKPPLLFELAPPCDAAFRPVHIKNVGLGAAEPLDGFWQKTYETLGVGDVPVTVESFVDGQRLRAYFNSHAFAVNPAQGLLGRWLEHFAALVADRAFQAHFCQDELHQVFLHQAVLSALLVTSLDAARLCILPPDYNYPYNLHRSVPPERRAAALNDLVCIAYEDRALAPAAIDDIALHEPLKSWLAARYP